MKICSGGFEGGLQLQWQQIMHVALGSDTGGSILLHLPVWLVLNRLTEGVLAELIAYASSFDWSYYKKLLRMLL